MYDQIWEVTNSFFTRDIDDFIALDRPSHKWQNAYLGYDDLRCFMLCEYFQYHYFGQKAKWILFFQAIGPPLVDVGEVVCSWHSEALHYHVYWG